MIKEKISKRKAVILFKPSGTIAIGGELTAIQRKFYDGFLYIGKQQLEENINRKWFEVKLRDLKSLLNTKEQNKNNKYFKEQIRKLNKIEVEYNILEKDKMIEGFFNLITEGKFITDKETGEVVIKYNLPNMVKDSLLKNNKQALFAQINLAIKKNLKHKYSLILYDLIKDYENVEIPEITIGQFRKLFGIENKYKLFQDIRKYVLIPAVTEINNNPDIEFKVDISLKKQGSKYTHIKFIKTIKDKQIKENSNIDLDKFLNKLPEQLRSLISIKKTINKYLNQPERVKRNIDYFLKKYQNNQIEKPATYLILAIEKDYALKTFEEEQQKKVKEIEQRQRQEKEKKLKEQLRKEKDELLREAEERFNSLTEQEKEKFFKKFNKGMFNFSPEIKKDIIVGELFYQICTEKQIDPEKFTVLNT